MCSPPHTRTCISHKTGKLLLLEREEVTLTLKKKNSSYYFLKNLEKQAFRVLSMLHALSNKHLAALYNIPANYLYIFPNSSFCSKRIQSCSVLFYTHTHTPSYKNLKALSQDWTMINVTSQWNLLNKVQNIDSHIQPKMSNTKSTLSSSSRIYIVVIFIQKFIVSKIVWKTLLSSSSAHLCVWFFFSNFAEIP